MVYIITGGPASGKGTRSDILANALQIPHISTGDLLRGIAQTDKNIQEKLTRGEKTHDHRYVWDYRNLSNIQR